MNPETLFNMLKESCVLDKDYKHKVLCAYLEIYNFDDFEEKVRARGENWDDNINLWSGLGWEDYGREMLDCCGYNIPEHLLDFFDLERYGKYCGDYNVYECENGLIEIY